VDPSRSFGSPERAPTRSHLRGLVNKPLLGKDKVTISILHDSAALPLVPTRTPQALRGCLQEHLERLDPLWLRARPLHGTLRKLRPTPSGISLSQPLAGGSSAECSGRQVASAGSDSAVQIRRFPPSAFLLAIHSNGSVLAVIRISGTPQDWWRLSSAAHRPQTGAGDPVPAGRSALDFVGREYEVPQAGQPADHRNEDRDTQGTFRKLPHVEHQLAHDGSLSRSCFHVDHPRRLACTATRSGTPGHTPTGRAA